MNDNDIARCQRAINLANAGQTEAAYKQFCRLYNQDYNNQRDVTLLYWLAYTTPYASEAQRTIIAIAQIDPSHPKLQELRAYTYKKQMRHEYNPLDILSPTLQCPYCHYIGPVRVREKISTAGWIFLGVFLFIFFFCLCGLMASAVIYAKSYLSAMIICFFLGLIGLFLKKRYYACSSCGITLGDTAY